MDTSLGNFCVFYFLFCSAAISPVQCSEIKSSAAPRRNRRGKRLDVASKRIGGRKILIRLLLSKKICDCQKNSSKRTMFTEGEDVLMRGSDGLLYFGVLVEVEEIEALVRFGDGTEKTAKFSDLRRLGSGLPEENLTQNHHSDHLTSPEPAKTTCYSSPSPRVPTPPPPILSPYDDEKRLPFHVLQARRELPYDFDSLIWDTNHERNIDEKYCYCGESGVW